MSLSRSCNYHVSIELDLSILLYLVVISQLGSAPLPHLETQRSRPDYDAVARFLRGRARGSSADGVRRVVLVLVLVLVGFLDQGADASADASADAQD